MEAVASENFAGRPFAITFFPNRSEDHLQEQP